MIFSWCGHCKRLAPTWTDLAKKFSGNAKVSVVKVDCTVEKDLCNAQGIRGYPTIMYFPKGSKTPEKYQGARDLDSLQKWLEAKA